MSLKSNNNKRIIYKIAKASFISSKLKAGFMSLTIGLAICFIMVMGLSTLNYKTYEKETVKGMQDCMFYEVSLEQIDNLKQNENIKCVMTYRTGIERHIGDIKINPVYYDYDIEDIRTYKLASGNVPVKENEIVIDGYVLKELGKNAKLGEQLEILGQTFVVSGLLDNGKGLSYPVLFSKEYSKKGSIFENSRTDALIKITDDMKIPSTEYIKNFFFELGKENGIERRNVNYNDKFVESFSLDSKEISTFFVLSIAVLVVSGIVIYSIFYLSVSSKVREYAQFRTIGMSKKQMKKMIKIEGLNYCKLGITLGIIVGGIISYFLVREGYTFLNFVKISIVSIALGVFAVLISVSKPAKVASEVSPVEGLRYTGDNENISASSKLCRDLNPISLAKIEVKKNKKKTLMTLISLIIGGVLFIFAAAYSSAMDELAYARQGTFQNSEYHISFTEEAKENSKNGIYDVIKEKNNLTELKKELEQLEEIEKVKVNKAFPVKMEYNGELFDDVISPMYDSHTISAEKALIDGIGDYNKLKANKEVYFPMSGVFKEVFGWSPKINDKIELHYFNEEDRSLEVTVGGIGSNMFSGYNIEADNTTAYGWLLVPDNMYEEIVGDLDTTRSLHVATKNHIYNEKLDNKVKELVNKYEGIEITTFTDYYANAKENLAGFKNVILGMSVFIVLFSFINLINTVITSITSRKKEIAVLQSIGMSKKQVNKMLIFENIYLALPNCIISGILGPILSLVVIEIFEYFGMNYMIFHLPVFAILGYLFISIFVPSIVAICSIKIFNKESIVDRLRDN